MLEHCVPADHAEALAGDLLEDFRAGRSDGWYWRQTLSACGVSWAEGLRVRMPLVLFAMLWCMLAPAWKVFVDGVDSAPVTDRFLAHFGGLWIIPAFAGWLVLHSLFLWAGILTYYVANTSLGKAFRNRNIKRAFILAPLVFTPAYGAMMVWGALYWYSFFANAKLATTPLGQIADLQLLANVVRLPFLIALVVALWNLVPQSARTSQALLAESLQLESSAQAASFTLAPPIRRRSLAFMVGTGLINAMIAAFVLCQLPPSHTPTLQSIFMRAALYVGIGVFAGFVGTYLHWHSPASPFRTNPPLPFPLFALVCAAGWVWVPSLGMFRQQISGLTALVAGIGAFFLAVGLRQLTSSLLAPAPQLTPSPTEKGFELFAESLYSPSGEASGYIIAISLFAALMALAAHENLIAAALLATGTFLFAWKRTFVSSSSASNPYRRPALRLALVAIPAVLITAWALLDGVAHRNRSESLAVLAADNPVPAREDSSKEARPESRSRGNGGYESLILWPYPEKKPFGAPIVTQSSWLKPGTRQPLIIRFDGSYWYLQNPDKHPGPTAHEAHGTPLGADIRSINDMPLVMDAHQELGGSIPISRCGRIDVEIENRDDRVGTISMAVLLTDASAPGKPEVYLGQKMISPLQEETGALDLAATGASDLAMKRAGRMETIEFAVPAGARVRRFNEITVMLLSDGDRGLVGPKIAVRSFELFAR